MHKKYLCLHSTVESGYKRHSGTWHFDFNIQGDSCNQFMLRVRDYQSLFELFHKWLPVYCEASICAVGGIKHSYLQKIKFNLEWAIVPLLLFTLRKDNEATKYIENRASLILKWRFWHLMILICLEKSTLRGKFQQGGDREWNKFKILILKCHMIPLRVDSYIWIRLYCVLLRFQLRKLRLCQSLYWKCSLSKKGS